MHRQSLGSPASKLHTNGLISAREDIPTLEDLNRNDQISSLNTAINHDEHLKSLKSPPKPHRIIHLIPILTVLCFLILYLSSHDPSLKDLSHFNGYKLSSNHIDTSTTSIDDFGRFVEIEKGNVLAIRSLRSLQEINRNRLHRKIGDF